MFTAAFAILFSAFLPQAAERTFSLTQAHTPQSAQEIVTVVRVVTGIRQASLDDVRRSVTMGGTEEQLRVAEWLVAALDKPKIVPQEYGVPGTADEKVRVFYLAYAQTPQDLQEFVTLIRALADAQHINFYTRLQAVVLRGNPWRISLAEWLIDELNRPAGAAPPPGPREYRLPGGNDILPPEEVFVRIFYTRARTPQELTRMLAGMRSAANGIPRSFVNNARHAIIVRASADGVALAEQALAAMK